MPLDKIEVAVIGCVALGGSYLAFLLLGLQAILIILLIASLVAFLLARRWLKLREKGNYLLKKVLSPS